jgi:hypothetical protein
MTPHLPPVYNSVERDPDRDPVDFVHKPGLGRYEPRVKGSNVPLITRKVAPGVDGACDSFFRPSQGCRTIPADKHLPQSNCISRTTPF